LREARMIRFFRKQRLKRSFITRLRLVDAPMLAALHRKTFPRPWSSAEFEALLAESTSHAFGLKIADNLIAFLLLRVAADEVEILTIAVHPRWRRLQCAERLMLHGFGQAMSRGARKCHLEVEAANRGAIRLYEKLGFSETGRRARYYQSSTGGDAVIMSRQLA
jgi:[ribosomal protein S18]-alanine N-acetyltransferase